MSLLACDAHVQQVAGVGWCEVRRKQGWFSFFFFFFLLLSIEQTHAVMFGGMGALNDLHKLAVVL